MMRHTLSVSRRGTRLAVSILAISAVTACSEGGDLAFLQPKDSGGEVTRNAASTTRLVERDVEAPDVFSITEAGLWDGRPSLGGVWVAHPDVNEPERVIIRNSANGKFVIGALFRRERDIPGPRLQASSDAAAALGLLAGAPVQLNVTALRREEDEIAPEPSAEAAPAPAAEAPRTAPAPAEPPESDAIASAAAAAIESAAPETAAAETADSAAAGTVAGAAPARKPWFGARLFGRKPGEDVGPPLNALAPQPVAAAAPAVGASELPRPAARPAPKNSALSKPFIQIGIFSVQSNANRSADQMRRAGMVPTVYEQSTNGKTFWRVVVGPTQDASERSALLDKIKGVGYSDAYAVTN